MSNVFGIVDVVEDETVEVITHKGQKKSGRLIAESFNSKVEKKQSDKRTVMGLAKSGKARDGSKLQRAVAIVKGLEGLREESLKALVAELDIKRGNATIYYNKAMVLLDNADLAEEMGVSVEETEDE